MGREPFADRQRGGKATIQSPGSSEDIRRKDPDRRPNVQTRIGAPAGAEESAGPAALTTRMRDSLASNAGGPTPSDLGTLLGEHRTPPEVLRREMFLAMAGGLASMGAFAYSAWRWVDALTRYGVLAVWRLSLPWIAAGVIWGMVAVVAFVSFLNHRRLAVRTHTRGLRLEKGKRRESIEWGQIKGIQVHAVRYGIGRLSWGQRSTLRLERRDRRIYRFHSSLANFSLLVDTVKGKVYPILLQELRQALQEGDPLEFGHLTLTSIGIHKGHRLIPWGGLEAADLSNGWLSLRGLQAGRPSWIRVPAYQVPNVELCVQLIEHLSRR